ncbi:MAG: acetyl esterase/lipase [Planctomycetota bacterium]|jgi:acetyl esterase/lipase
MIRARGTTLGICLGVSIVLSSACGSSPDRQNPAPAVVIPKLTEIFHEPSIAGVAPSAESLSADGRWLLLRWDSTVPGSGDPPRATLRLMDVMRPGDSKFHGSPLVQVLPPSPEGEAADADRTTWSESGHLLAISRGRELYLHDPKTRQTVLVFDDPDPATEAEVGDTPARLESEIRSLAFSKDDRELRFMDSQDLFGIPLPDAGLPAQTLSLAEVVKHSEGLDGAAHRLQWSDSLETVFGRGTRPVDLPEQAAQDPAEENALEEAEPQTTDSEPNEDPEAEEAPPTPQIWRTAREQGVLLEGMESQQGLRSDRLSPDGRWVVARSTDNSGDPAPNILPRWLGDRVTTRNIRSQLADDLPSPTALWAWSTATGKRQPVDPLKEALVAEAPETTETTGATETTEGEAPVGETPDAGAAEEPQRPWVSMLGWAPQPEENSPARFAISVRSQDHREKEIWLFTEGYSQMVWSERDPRWVGGPGWGARWTPDGRFLILSSEASEHLKRPGHSQLFAVSADGGTPRQLTEVEGEVAEFSILASGAIVFSASREDPGRRSIGLISAGSVSGESPEAQRWLATPIGWNASVRASDDASIVVFEHQSLLQPGELWATDGERAWPLTNTTPNSFRDTDWIRPITVTGTAPDGATLFAHVYLPPGVTLEEPGSPRAAIVFVHGAGYLQNVTDSMTNYPLNAMFHSRLAEMGYPVIDVDYRGSAGYGQDFRTAVQYHLGGKDLDDLHTIVDLLVDRGLVDPERVGLYGGSYGGFLTLMALFTAPERWAAGAALRSVTDWRTYNPGYTQPRLGRPSTHPEAYARSSPIDLVDGLADPLYLFHGLEDSNVFAQDTIRLMEEMIDRGLEFDAMLYPSQGHAFRDGPHWLDEYRRIEAHLIGALGAPIQD